jgi:hypothetical protein
MRAPLRSVLPLALLAALLPIITTRPAAAAPAEPYDISDCYVDVDDVLQLCFSFTGVLHVNEAPSGTAQYTDNGRYCDRVTNLATGEVLGEGCNSYHVVDVVRDGELQVDRLYTLAESTVGGTTCTALIHVVYANGAVRHEAIGVECG